MAETGTLVLDQAALDDLLAHEFSKNEFIRNFRVDEVTSDHLVLRLLVDEKHLRPGDTVSGPAMFALADVAMYLAILSRIGPELRAATTNCSIDFMRRPSGQRDLVATTRVLKIGRRLAVADVLVFSDGEEEPVARGSGTYAI